MNANSDREYIDNKVGDVRTAVDDLRTLVADRFIGVHARFDATDAQFRAVDARMESSAQAVKSEIIKWIAGLLIATVSMFIALAGLMVNLLSRQPPAQPPPAAPPTSTPYVVIQLAPQGATVVPAAPPAAKS